MSSRWPPWSQWVTMSIQAPVVHLELHTNDLSSARDLYGELCGWHPDRVDTRHGSYLALDMGRRLGGGIVESSTAKPLWLPYVRGRRHRRRRPITRSRPGRLAAARRRARGRRAGAASSPRPSGGGARVLAAEALAGPRGAVPPLSAVVQQALDVERERAGEQDPGEVDDELPGRARAPCPSPRRRSAMPMLAAAGIVVTEISTPISAPDFAVLRLSIPAAPAQTATMNANASGSEMLLGQRVGLDVEGVRDQVRAVEGQRGQGGRGDREREADAQRDRRAPRQIRAPLHERDARARRPGRTRARRPSRRRPGSRESRKIPIAAMIPARTM